MNNIKNMNNNDIRSIALGLMTVLAENKIEVDRGMAGMAMALAYAGIDMLDADKDKFMQAVSSTWDTVCEIKQQQEQAQSMH